MRVIFNIKKEINSGRLSDLVPITEFTERGMGKYSNYPLSAVSYSDIIEAFPFLSGEPLYASKSITAFCYYYDGGVMFPVNLSPSSSEENDKHITPAFLIPPNENAESFYKKVKRSAFRAYEKGYGYSVIGDDSLAIDLFLKNMDKEKDLFKSFTDIYTSMDYGFDRITNDDLKKVLNARKPKQAEEVMEKIKNLPDEITVYRGEGSKSRKDGFSYSTDINTALFFASRALNPEDKGKIITGKVRKEDVIFYTDERGESEIVALPDKVYDKNKHELYSLADVFPHELIDKYFEYREYIREYTCLKDGSDHGKLHLVRVLLLGLILLEYEYDDYFDEMTDYDIDTLCTALSFHDIGRTNDAEDEKHGRDSFIKLSEVSGLPDYDKQTVSMLMEYHCLDDKLFHERYGKSVLFDIMKDADALDRVRFRIKELDVNFLRGENSWKYVPVAVQLVSGIEL